MTKKDKGGQDEAGDEARSVLDDLPYAEESPAVQQRRPGVRPGAPTPSGPDRSASAGPSDPAGGAGGVDGDDAEPYTGPERRRAGGDDEGTSELSEEALAEAQLIVQNDVVAIERERDDYLDQLRRVQADFENYRKRTLAQQGEVAERANESLVGQLLPVLDACDAAVQHGAEDVAPVQAQLVDTLEKAGLERLDPAGEPFDPNFHEAVMHEPADDGDGGGSVVAEVLRTGYTWKGRVLRPAMVKVRG
ncbi:MAG TPA: nucleotide exchange factor GrpE [Acidimicrobiales bacterium]|nr:nucleotide exchange factor GrpE [Acidimicrobiales bacterium]